MHLSPPLYTRSTSRYLFTSTKCQQRHVSIFATASKCRQPNSTNLFVRGDRVVLGARYIHPRGPTKPLPVPNGKFDVIFFGGDVFSCLTLQKLEQAKDTWNSLQVVTQGPKRRTHHGSSLVHSPVELLAKELGLPCHNMPDKKAKGPKFELPSPFRTGSNPTPDPNHLLVVSSFGRPISSPILSHFHPSRKLNIHPSLIPKYRGAAPIQWTIMDGLEESGVSIIEVERILLGYDVGDIWAQKKLASCFPNVPGDSTYETLMPVLAAEGGELLIDVMRKMINGTQPTSIEQDASKVTNAPAIENSHATVDWWTWNANKVEQVSRAIMHQKPIHTYVFDPPITVQLFDVSVLPEEAHNSSLTEPGMAAFNKRTGQIEVNCADDTQVAVGRLKQMNKKMMSAKEWWIGIPENKKQADGTLKFNIHDQDDSYVAGVIVDVVGTVIKESP
ncbi:Formyltransferase [Serendipita vermifera]|nr:Formyltransferase [Serendipita vermifera]